MTTPNVSVAMKLGYMHAVLTEDGDVLAECGVWHKHEDDECEVAEGWVLVFGDGPSDEDLAAANESWGPEHAVVDDVSDDRAVLLSKVQQFISTDEEMNTNVEGRRLGGPVPFMVDPYVLRDLLTAAPSAGVDWQEIANQLDQRLRFILDQTGSGALYGAARSPYAEEGPILFARAIQGHDYDTHEVQREQKRRRAGLPSNSEERP